MFDFGGGCGSNLVLNGALKSKKFSHAYLFCGDEFVGKRAVARKFAMAIFCQEKGQGPCFECNVCRRFLSGNFVDYCEYSTADFLKVGAFSVQDARQLISDAFVKPIEGKFKIFLIGRVDNLLPAAANALLKLIEEPPKNVIFLLTARSKFSVLPTIASRCFLVNVFCEGAQTCLELLKRKYIDIDEQELKKVVRLGEGQFEKAKLILTNSEWQTALEIGEGLFNAYITGNELKFLKFIAKIDTNSKLVFAIFKFFSISLSFFVRRKLESDLKLNFAFLKEAQRVLECFENVKLLILRNCNLKLALVKLSCSVFEQA